MLLIPLLGRDDRGPNMAQQEAQQQTTNRASRQASKSKQKRASKQASKQLGLPLLDGCLSRRGVAVVGWGCLLEQVGLLLLLLLLDGGVYVSRRGAAVVGWLLEQKAIAIAIASQSQQGR